MACAGVWHGRVQVRRARRNRVRERAVIRRWRGKARAEFVTFPKSTTADDRGTTMTNQIDILTLAANPLISVGQI